jgi:hypothetical protein
MSDQYRESEHCDKNPYDGNHVATFDSDCKNCGMEQMFVEPDSRLQAIADAWEACNEYQRRDIYGYWPEFSVLLDALTEENDDET